MGVYYFFGQKLTNLVIVIYVSKPSLEKWYHLSFSNFGVAPKDPKQHKKGGLQQREKEIHGNRFYADHQVSLSTQKSHRLCGFKQNHSKFVSSFSINKELSLIYILQGLEIPENVTLASKMISYALKHCHFHEFSGSRVSGNSGSGFFSGLLGFLDTQVFYNKNLYFNWNVFYNRPNNSLENQCFSKTRR